MRQQMGNQRLREVGRKLDITAEQIWNIRKAGVLNKLWYWVIGAVVAIIAVLIWFFSRKDSTPDPFAGGGLPPGYRRNTVGPRCEGSRSVAPHG